MKKTELDFLERVFAAEIEGRLYQTKSKLAKQMESDGYVFATTKRLGYDRFGTIEVSGYCLTDRGRIAYCESDRCKNAV